MPSASSAASVYSLAGADTGGAEQKDHQGIRRKRRAARDGPPSPVSPPSSTRVSLRGAPSPERTRMGTLCRELWPAMRGITASSQAEQGLLSSSSGRHRDTVLPELTEGLQEPSRGPKFCSERGNTRNGGKPPPPKRTPTPTPNVNKKGEEPPKGNSGSSKIGV